jgi:putative SOS response-associated peptidase YedK
VSGNWLIGEASTIQDLVTPYPPEAMQAWAVDRRVSRTQFDEAGLMEPIGGEE